MLRNKSAIRYVYENGNDVNKHVSDRSMVWAICYGQAIGQQNIMNA